MNAKVYYGKAGETGIPKHEIGNVKDVTLNLEAGEADITTRDNGGFRATAPTLKECSAEWEMILRDNDSALAAIRTAWRNGTPIPLAILTDKVELDGDGPVGDFSVTNCTRNEPLEEAITYSVSVKLAKFRGWLPDDKALLTGSTTPPTETGE